ncbi:MAG TPA: hypothetical protein DC048_09715 [Planctomycetaceae bacterium]|nr:hypothetical protein [Planctomycetaceae bacterium]
MRSFVVSRSGKTLRHVGSRQVGWVPASWQAVLIVCLAATVAVPARGAGAAEALPLEDTGVAIVPSDAAFFSATLRAREQVDLLVGSRAWASLLELPAVRRGIESLEEQRTMPGSPLALVDTLMQLPENEQAIKLLRDMVATDTFVYGEPSCITFLELTTKLNQAIRAAAGRARLQLELDGDASRAGRARIVPVARQAAEVELSTEELQARLVLKALSDNIDLLVVPDIVWGFRTGMADAAVSQLKRVEVLGRLATQASPDLAEALERREIAGGEFVTITLEADRLPLAALAREIAGDIADTPEADTVLERLRQLKLVIALGVVGDRVMLSIGDSTDHLEKLVAPAAGAGTERAAGLLRQEPFAPLRAAAAERITGISYLSSAMARAIMAGQLDFEPAIESFEDLARQAEMSDEAIGDLRRWAAGAGEWLTERMPVPGPWLSYAFLAAQGYEGSTWDWGTNRSVDATRRLDLLEHAGGAPLAVVVSRFKQDPELLDASGDFARQGWELFQRHGMPALDADGREKVEKVADEFGPLAMRFAEIIRDKLAPAIGDGQVGLVLDAKTRVKKLQRELPASADPLPVPEAAIVLPLTDKRLFIEGLNDLFELTDRIVAAARALDPDGIPAAYRVPAPEKTKVETGTVWSFAMPRSGIDDQVRPTIGVGDKAAVFCFGQAQASRMLAGATIETGQSLTKFEEPLSTAAALDVAGLLEAAKPWIAYAARYVSVQQRTGEVDADEELAAEDETDQVREVLRDVGVVIEALQCLRVAVAETSTSDGALVTRWRNVIRDLPAK